MSQTLDQWNTQLLPYICVRCERSYYATRREMASAPHILCAGCYTKLVFSENTDEVLELQRLGAVLQSIDIMDPETLSPSAIECAIACCLKS